MIKVGITGIIGSGKTIVSRIFEILGVPVYNADINAQKLMHSDDLIKKRLVERFGENVYINNKLNKTLLSEKIFNSNENRLYVNSVVHPAVMIDFIGWTQQQDSEIVAIESALLHEINISNIIDFVIEVQSPVELLAERLCIRDNISYEDAIKKINVQLESKIYKITPDFVIENDQKKFVLEQTIEILRILKNRDGKAR